MKEINTQKILFKSNLFRKKKKNPKLTTNEMVNFFSREKRFVVCHRYPVS
jgi:hypothetical protein